jgi:protein O-mannosyl-transferase
MRPSEKKRKQTRNPAATKARDNASLHFILLAAAIIVAAALAYGNTFDVPFVFDDDSAIGRNTTIRQLWPPWTALSPPHSGAPVTGRPILNWSLAVNYAVNGLNPRGYHVVNLAIHILAALLLYAVVRRTLAGQVRFAAAGTSATLLAAIIALLWALHPLQTESVTYVSQRAESLVSLFYLLTLYCAIRSASSTRSAAWSCAAIISCTLGMASKEVMVSAPLIVLLYDRTFLYGSFREALNKRWKMYAGMAASWFLLAALVVGSAGRGDSAGFGLGMSPWEYALTQCRAIPHYLRLCFWPTGLCLDYGDALVKSVWAVWPQAMGMAALVVLTVVALWRWPAAGFLGAFFLAVLAPTSSVVPVLLQTVAEHRMYLPSAAVTIGTVAGAYLAGGWLVRRKILTISAAKSLGIALALSVAVIFGFLTYHRNADYSSVVSIWRDTAAKAPDNRRAYNNLGASLVIRGEIEEAIIQYKNALKIKPDYADAHNNLGVALVRRGQFDEGISHYRKALETTPDFADAHNNLGAALLRLGRIDEGIEHIRRALELNPNSPETRNNYALALAKRGQNDQAIAEYHKALDLNPGYIEASVNLGATLINMGRLDEAIAEYRRILELSPRSADVHNSLGAALATAGRIAEAAVHFQKALEIQPDSVDARENLQRARSMLSSPGQPRRP